MLTLQMLKFSGIGRFVDEQEIDFAKLPGLVQVDGLNKNTGGSSGAGKSTVFNALDYLLGLNDTPNGILQSRLTKEGISVEGTFDWDGKPITIKRAKKGLAILEDGNWVQGSSKLAEEKLDRILAIPRPLFRQILHKRQDERGFFLKLTPKEIHEFLTDALELNEYQGKVEFLDERIKSVTATHLTTQNTLKIHEASLEATRKAREAMGEAPAMTIKAEDIEPIKQGVDILQAELAKVTQEQLQAVGQLEAARPKVTVQPYDRTRIITLNDEIKRIADKARSLGETETARQQEVLRQILTLKTEKERALNLISYGVKAKSDAQTVAAEIKMIRDSMCPTCQQNWATDSAKKKEAELLEKLKSFKLTIQNGLEAEQKRDEILAKIADLELQVKPIKIAGLDELLAQKDQFSADLTADLAQEKSHQAAELAKSQAALNDWSSQMTAMRSRHDAETQLMRSQLQEARRLLDSYTFKHKAEKEALDRYNTQYYLHAKNIERWESTLAEHQGVVARMGEELEMLEEAKRAVKSFMSCSFEEALQAIGDMATDLIHSIPNMATATISIEGTKETAKGAVKEEVNAVLNVDGEEAVPLRSLSGGERTSVDLAVDLAVIDLIQTRTNKGINIFVLDEPFTGLENINIEPILELLRTANIGKKLFIVDHNPIIKEAIHDRILVVREGAESNLNN